MPNAETPFHILTLDGGGTRGIYTAQLLANIERAFQAPLKKCFNLIAGTSAGAIIAGAAATGIPMEEIVYLFEKEAPQLFRKKWYRHPLFSSRYAKELLAKVLAKHLPELFLNDIATPLMITCSDLINGSGYVFKTGGYRNPALHTSNDSEPLLNVRLREAILASCAAPTFFDPSLIGNALLSDGSLWASNPSLVALTEAVSVFGRNIDELRMLSIGTGRSQNMYRKHRKWGFLTGWGGQKIISYLLTVQSQTAAEMTKSLLKENYLRVNPQIDFWELDGVGQLAHLKSLAARDFERLAAEIETFIRSGR